MVARVAQWLWRLQPDTLGLSPSAAGFSPFSPFLVEQAELHNMIFYIGLSIYTLWKLSTPGHKLVVSCLVCCNRPKQVITMYYTPTTVHTSPKLHTYVHTEEQARVPNTHVCTYVHKYA